jgi:hypothetical protein
MVLVSRLVESFVTSRVDLETEKRATQKMWAKREKQLEWAVTNTVGFSGDPFGMSAARACCR